MALKLTTEMVSNLIHNWHEGSTEVRRAFANSLFEYLVYDLDIQRLVDFKLRPWAELLMQLKVAVDEHSTPPSDSGSTTEGKPTVLWCSRRALGTYPPPRCRWLFSEFWRIFIAA